MFLVPSLGGAELGRLHDACYRGMFSGSRRQGAPYRPHVTVAAGQDHGVCEALATSLNGAPLPLYGRVEAVDVVIVGDRSVETAAHLALGGG